MQNNDSRVASRRVCHQYGQVPIGSFSSPRFSDRFVLGSRYSSRSRKKSIEHSLSFGVYKGDKQVGFARVITDYATFAYIGDVFILEDYRGQGLSKWLMQVIADYSELQGLRRWLLLTRDAHGLYKKTGFVEPKTPERYMEKVLPDVYKNEGV